MKALFTAMAVLLPCAAHANCAAHDDAVAYLAGEFGEARQSIGLAAGGAVMEFFANGETGTWTVTMTRPGGLTCIVADGVAYEIDPPPLKGDPL